MGGRRLGGDCGRHFFWTLMWRVAFISVLVLALNTRLRNSGLLSIFIVCYSI